MYRLCPSPSSAPACRTAAARLLRCARTHSRRQQFAGYDINMFEHDAHVACRHVRCCRWLPTRVLRDCRFAPTAELDLHLYAIGCDIVCRPFQCLTHFKRNPVYMHPTPPSCNCGMPPLGPPQVRYHPPVAGACALSQFCRAGSNLSLAKYLRPERLPAVFRSIDWWDHEWLPSCFHSLFSLHTTQRGGLIVTVMQGEA